MIYFCQFPSHHVWVTVTLTASLYPANPSVFCPTSPLDPRYYPPPQIFFSTEINSPPTFDFISCSQFGLIYFGGL